RNTVVQAYEELAAEGWIRATNGLGTFVEEDLPVVENEGKRRAQRRVAGFEIPSPRLAPESIDRGGLTVLDWGVPDLRLFPTAAFARAYRRALSKPSPDLLQYSSKPTPLHDAIASMLLDTRGFAFADPSRELLLTRGSQMSMYLVSRVLLREGDVVAMEDPG